VDQTIVLFINLMCTKFDIYVVIRAKSSKT